MSGISRRAFITGGALLAGGAVGSSMLAGYATRCEAEELSGGDEGLQSRPYSTKEFDVVVVGSGLAGLSAARRAIDEGATVAIVDKGQYGHSGASGINWGHAMASLEFADDLSGAIDNLSFGMPFGSDGMSDQAYTAKIVEAYSKFGIICDAVKIGCVTEHEQDGTPTGGNTMPDTGAPTQDAGYFPRMLAQYVKRRGANIFDYTYALDVLIGPDGSAAGLAAIDLETGEALVFRAKSVILATGSYSWLCGWNGMTPFTHSSADCTGDGVAMCLRAGLSMRDMEELCYDNGQYTPLGTRQCMSGMGVEITDHYRGFNNNYENFADIMVENPAAYNQGTYMRLEMKEIWEGRGTEHGGIWALTDGLEEEERYYRNAKWNMQRIFDYELPQYVELIPQCWETAGRPFTLNADTSETEIPGLFHAGSASFVWNGGAMMSSVGGGLLAGAEAGRRAVAAERTPVDTDQINSIFAEAYGLLLNEPEDAIRARNLMRNVQNSFWDGMYFLRDEEGIQATINELTRIQNEDLPRMNVPDKTPQFNIEWRNALEARNMITVGIGAAQAALIRRECRGAHCRTDYPTVDNANYMANTKVQLSGGAWSAEMVPVDDPIVPLEMLIEQVPQIGLE